jgi:hypothetical protein
MTTVLILGWIALLAASYKGAEIILKKNGLL